jgi:hypothetical protein
MYDFVARRSEGVKAVMAVTRQGTHPFAHVLPTMRSSTPVAAKKNIVSKKRPVQM